MKPLSVIKLIPKTHKAKNRVKENGEIWVVIKQGKMVNGVMEDKEADNDSLFIAPWKNRQNVRWIKKINDPDFNWEDMSDKIASSFEEAQVAIKNNDTEKLVELLTRGWN